MREVSRAVVVLCLLTTAAPRGQEVTAEELFARMREALGGAPALDAIRSVRAEGVSVRAIGPLRVESDVELRIAFPDRFLRIERLKLAGPGSEVGIGFNGPDLIQYAFGPGGVRVDPAANLETSARAAAERASAAGARQDLARLLLGLFAAPLEFYPLSLAIEGVAEAPDGRADVVSVRAADGFEARLFVDQLTRRSLMLSWHAPDVLGAIRQLSATQTPGGSGTSDAVAVAAHATRSVEHRLYFSDYARAGALIWPHRLTRTAAGETVEELTFRRITINPRFDERAFAPGR